MRLQPLERLIQPLVLILGVAVGHAGGEQGKALRRRELLWTPRPANGKRISRSPQIGCGEVAERPKATVC